MKKLAACFATCLMLVLPLASEAHRRFDGAWWNSQPKTTRLGIVDGLVDGYESGYFFARRFEHTGDAPSAPQPTFKKTPELYEAAITNFYIAHPAARLSPGDLMLCLADEPIFSCDEFAKPYESKK